MRLSISKLIIIILLSAFAGLVANILFGDMLVARVATWHWVRKYNLLKPRAPLVINTREEVRVSDSNDLIATLNRTKTKVAALVQIQDDRKILKGSAVVVSADGVFATSKLAIADAKPETLVVVLNDGSTYPVQSLAQDPASTTVLLKTTANNLSVLSFASGDELAPGNRAVLLGLETEGNPYFLASFIATSERMGSGVVFSDVPARTIGIQSVSGSMPGQAVVTVEGGLVGIWDGSSLLPSSVLKEAMDAYFSNSGKIARSTFGFYYSVLSKEESRAKKLASGLKVARAADGRAAVLPSGPAAKAGLQEGDIITKIGNTDVASASFPDALLLGQKYNTPVTFEVFRGIGNLTITLIPTLAQ